MSTGVVDAGLGAGMPALTFVAGAGGVAVLSLSGGPELGGWAGGGVPASPARPARCSAGPAAHQQGRPANQPAYQRVGEWVGGRAGGWVGSATAGTSGKGQGVDGGGEGVGGWVGGFSLCTEFAVLLLVLLPSEEP